MLKAARNDRESGVTNSTFQQKWLSLCRPLKIEKLVMRKVGGLTIALLALAGCGAAVSAAQASCSLSSWSRAGDCIRHPGQIVSGTIKTGNHVFGEVAKVICDVAEVGQKNCSVNGGVGVDVRKDGTANPYTYDPANPDVHYPLGSTPLELPSDADLATAERMFGKSTELQHWEEEQEDALFFKPGDSLGLPWEGMMKQVKSPTGKWQIRKGGQFLSPRTDPRYPNGYRLHGGLDVKDNVGEKMGALTDGVIVSIAHPTKGCPWMTGLIYTTPEGYTIQQFYFAPSAGIKPGDHINAGETIGIAQDLHSGGISTDDHKYRQAYPNYVEQHTHVTVKDRDGRFVDPEGKIILIMKPHQAPIIIPKVGH